MYRPSLPTHRARGGEGAAHDERDTPLTSVLPPTSTAPGLLSPLPPVGRVLSLSPSFTHSLRKIFSDPVNDELCGWARGGETIIVHRVNDFSEQILPKYFKHANFRSVSQAYVVHMVHMVHTQYAVSGSHRCLCGCVCGAVSVGVCD